MTDQAASLHVTNRPLDYTELAGRAAMALGERPRWKFKSIDGDRRRFNDRTSGAATLTSIQGGKDQQCQ
jgi:hypothetical protein